MRLMTLDEKRDHLQMRVYEYLKHHDMPRYEFSKLVGLCNTTMHNFFEQPDRKVSMRSLMKIEKFLDDEMRKALK